MKILQEVLILKKLVHQNIIRLLEVFENNKNFFIVMEYASDGDLLSYIKKNGKLREEKGRIIFRQVVEGVKHCHQNFVLHRDIKLDNILLDNKLEVKICDFGVSRFIKRGTYIKE